METNNPAAHSLTSSTLLALAEDAESGGDLEHANYILALYRDKRAAELVKLLEEHGHGARVLPSGNLEVVEVYTLAGRLCEDVVSIAPTLSAVRDWLGY